MLVAYGLNHKTAPLTLREQLSILASDVDDHLRQLHTHPDVHEILVLSTCNRTEWYLQTDAQHFMSDWLGRQYRLPSALLQDHTYCYQEKAALQHALRVASGLDSMILGETEIFGQMKLAYTSAKRVGTIGESLDPIFQFIFSKAKQVRHHTQISAHPLSIAYVAVSLAKRIFSQLNHTKVLLVGAGETIDLVARYLHEEKTQDIVFANRTLAHADMLAERYHGLAISLADIPAVLPRSDIVITATDSPLALIGKGLVERAIRMRKHRPILMVDLAVPRDIEPEVTQLSDVYLYNIDDLNEVVSDSLLKRRDAAVLAETIISQHVEEYQTLLTQRDHQHLIKNYRQKMEATRDELLNKAVKQLQQGLEPSEVLRQFSHALINQCLHQPTHKLRIASARGDETLLAAATELFDLT